MTTKLCLGTVQFGMEYGINNYLGKPSKTAVFDIIDEAIKAGIEYFDTAAAYGVAEQLLGEYQISRKGAKVISKLRPNLITSDCDFPQVAIEEQIRGSLDRMGLSFLDGYLLHTPENFYDKRVIDGLVKCKEKGLINNIGVSVYETEHAIDVVSSGLVNYIQVPYSIFDQRLDKTDFFEKAQKNNVTVFARSAFLQGLILMQENKIPDHLFMAKSYLKEFDQIISDFGLTRIQAALMFSHSHHGIDYVVFGVDNLEQLKEDISITKDSREFDVCRTRLSASFQNISKSIIFPSLWKKG